MPSVDPDETELGLLRASSTIGKPLGRWLIEVGYALSPDGELLPVDVHVRLLPHYASSFDQTWFGKVISHADELLDLHPLPSGGLSRRMLTQVDLIGLGAKARAAARREPKRSKSKMLGRLALEPTRRSTGRPPSRTQAEVLRLLAATEETLLAGGTLADVAKANALSRESLRDLLSWARHDARPALFTNPGRGRRGGQLTQHARQLLEEHGGEAK